MVEFAGWNMPLSYEGTTAEHRAVRERVGVFDLCHMGRFALAGSDAVRLLERVTPSDIRGLAVGEARYTVLLTPEGGIVDDIIVTRQATGDAERFHLCVNAARRTADWQHLQAHGAELRAELTDLSGAEGQIAIQGKGAAELIRQFLAGPAPAFMHAVPGRWRGTPITVSRTGYSGELGVELFLPVALLDEVWAFLASRAAPCGLGARDTLRLEMGYPLYGHELSETTTPVAAGLSWAVQWDREGFLGRKMLLAERTAPGQRLVGFMLTVPGIPREGCAILAEGNRVGTVTSGNMGLSVGCGIGMGYVPKMLAKTGSALEIEVRGRCLSARTVKPPFYAQGSVKMEIG